MNLIQSVLHSIKNATPEPNKGKWHTFITSDEKEAKVISYRESRPYFKSTMPNGEQFYSIRNVTE